jgi:hypothetical protein
MCRIIPVPVCIPYEQEVRGAWDDETVSATGNTEMDLLRSIIQRMKNLSEILPLYGVEHDMLLSKMGDITIAYSLELPEIFTLSNEEYEAFHQAWVKAVKLLPVGAVLHKQDWYVQKKFTGDFEKEHSFLSLSSERFFHERPYLDHSCYLTLRPVSQARKSRSILCFLHCCVSILCRRKRLILHLPKVLRRFVRSLLRS